MIRHRDPAAAAARFVTTVLTDFFWLQFSVRLGLRRVRVVDVDHPLDALVPFEPARVGVYLDFIAFWIRPLDDVRRLHGATAQRRAAVEFLGLIRRCYQEAAEVYGTTMSTTRRPRYLRGRFLAIHAFDPHLLCVPSLHIMVVVLAWTFYRRLDAALGARLFGGAVAIADTVLYIKQHSVNCIPAALYAMGRITPDDVTEADVEAFTAALFADTASVAPDAAAAIRAHVLETWRALVADGASDSSWQPAVLRLLAELDRA
ncbi:hypothetical protein [Propioniciclava sinopodophylli]|uniref:hypothetical protein n=1 Tax=Propioniciclava sinopodophylli TaxID=1837344 RepID=UPI002490C699|nr:hypothetical protein [Propioniciclava sinopodophylli]